MYRLKQYKRDDAGINIFVGAAGLMIQFRDHTHNIFWHVRGYPISFVNAIRKVCRSGMGADGTLDDYPQTSANFAFVPPLGEGKESEWVDAHWYDTEQGGSGWRMRLRKCEISQIADILNDSH